jgi:hypothetical protein
MLMLPREITTGVGIGGVPFDYEQVARVLSF